LDVLKGDITAVREKVRSRWFIFGSAIKSNVTSKDLDILVIYERPQDAALIRLQIEATCKAFPIHLLLMTDAEENETNFIESVGAVEISNPGT